MLSVRYCQILQIIAPTSNSPQYPVSKVVCMCQIPSHFTTTAFTSFNSKQGRLKYPMTCVTLGRLVEMVRRFKVKLIKVRRMINHVKIFRNLCMYAHLILEAGVFKLRAWKRVSSVWSNISGSIDEAGQGGLPTSLG